MTHEHTNMRIKRFTDAEIATLRNDYEAHVPVPEIARKVGHSPEVVRQKVLALGLVRNSRVTVALRYAPPHLIAQHESGALTDNEFADAAQQWRRDTKKRKKAARDIRVKADCDRIFAGDGSPNTRMRAMRNAGATLEEIAAYFGITRERVRQIVSQKYRRKMAAKRAERVALKGPPIRTILRFWNKMHPAHQKQFLDAIGAVLAPRPEIEWS